MKELLFAALVALVAVAMAFGDENSNIRDIKALQQIKLDKAAVAQSLASPSSLTVPSTAAVSGATAAFVNRTSMVLKFNGRKGNVTPQSGDYPPSLIGAPSGSGTSTGTNTGDVTIGTANGLSRSGQVLSLQVATDAQPGAMTAADHALLPVSGTWTPTITFATPGDLLVTYSQQVGTYRKNGNLVIVNGRVNTSAFTYTTASGILKITGLPFTSDATANNSNVGGMFYTGITAAGYTQYVPRVQAGSAYIDFVGTGSGQPLLGISTTQVPSGTNPVTIIFTIAYQI